MEPGCVMEQEGKAISLRTTKKNNCTETLQSALSNIYRGASSVFQ